MRLPKSKIGFTNCCSFRLKDDALVLPKLGLNKALLMLSKYSMLFGTEDMLTIYCKYTYGKMGFLMNLDLFCYREGDSKHLRVCENSLSQV